MNLIADLAVAIVAFLHIVFFVLESFLWTRPLGRRIFRLSEDDTRATASLALNQGVYNAFLAAGLVWGLLAGPAAFQIKVFFLSCVIVAGVVGGLTAKRSILWMQAVPGLVALVLVFLTSGPNA